MSKEIINRVAKNQNLVTIDLEEYYPEGKRVLLDIKDWLYEGLILREKEFRQYVADHDWSIYQDTYVALTCTTDAIIPGWAYLLLASELSAYAKQTVVGTLETLETIIYQQIIHTLEISTFQDKAVIIKGCSNKPVPENASIALLQKIQPVAKSIRYGEACSSVPLYKRK